MIPGNDDAIRSCNLVTRVIADGIAAGRDKITPAELTAEPEAAEAPPEETAAAEAPEEPAEPQPEEQTAHAAVAEGSEAQ